MNEGVRVWRDPEELPDYFDDELEGSVFDHTMSVESFAALTGSIFAPPDDELMFPSEQSAPATTAQMTFDSLKRLAPKAAGYYFDASQLLDNHDDYYSPVELISHMLRELDALIRGVWWELLEFADETAPNLTNKDNHAAQIKALAANLKLNPQDIEVWLHAKNLHSYAHRGAIGPSKVFTSAFEDKARSLLAVFGKVATATESSYGLAILRIADLLQRDPRQLSIKILKHQIPYNPPLRQWFLAQIDQPRWLPILYESNYLDDAVDMYYQMGSAVIPVSHGARTMARLASHSSDDGIVDDLVSRWLAVDNVRVHCDVLRVLQSSPSPAYDQYVPTIHRLLQHSRWHTQMIRVFGGPGVLRFPSEVLRLALRAHTDNSPHARPLIRSVVTALRREAASDQVWTHNMNIALLGVEPLHRREVAAIANTIACDGRS